MKSNKLIISKNKGFITLSEIIIVIAISGVVAMLVAIIFMSQTQIFIRQQEDVGVAIENKQAIQVMADDLRQANELVSAIIIDSTTYYTQANTVIFKLPSINSSGDIIPNQTDIFIFTRNANNQLLKIVEPGPSSDRTKKTKILANNVINLIFNYDPAVPPNTYEQVEKVRISLTIKKVHTASTKQEEVEVILRNKI